MSTTADTGWRRTVIAGVGALLFAAGLAGPPRLAGASDGGVTQRVSVARDGAQADRPSVSPAISADGRYVAFQSSANLVADDTGGTVDVFIRDRATGTTTRVSVASDGTQADRASVSPAISADGSVVAFRSDARNLVDGDTNRAPDIFVRDLNTGLTTRVNVASDGTETEELTQSFAPAISANGRHVAFLTGAANLVDGDTNGERDHGCCGGDVFVHDRETGTTERVSVASDGTQADGSSGFAPAISADGRHVAFMSFATNLVPGDTNGRLDMFVHDRDTGTTTRVSVASDGTQAELDSQFPAISADGRHVAFMSFATNLVPGDTNGAPDVFVHDRDTGTTTRVSVAADGTQGLGGGSPAISADGRHVAFHSDNLVPDDTNEASDVFVRDRAAGTTTRVSVASDGTQADNHSGLLAISADGRHVAFESDATNLVAGDTNNVTDIFVHGPPVGSSPPPGTPPPGADEVACDEDLVPTPPFTDIAGNTHLSNIGCIVWYGLTQGTSATTYSPANRVTRDQMASFIARLMTTSGVTLPASSDQGFTDIAGNTHTDAINQLAELGVVLGSSATTYAPRQQVRRDQMASFLVRAYEIINDADLTRHAATFTDVAGNSHLPNIEKAATAGFTQGTTTTTYSPSTSVRRDQMASFLARVLDHGMADGHVTQPGS